MPQSKMAEKEVWHGIYIAGMAPGTCNYENDEGEYVVLNDDPVCLRISIYGSKRIVANDL